MEGYRWKAAVITLSDKGYAGKREDRSGPLICEMIKEAGYDVEEMILLPDEKEEIKKCLCTLCDRRKVDIILTTGGTGFAPRDCTPEATMEAAERNAPGIAEAMRLASLKVTYLLSGGRLLLSICREAPKRSGRIWRRCFQCWIMGLPY